MIPISQVLIWFENEFETQRNPENAFFMVKYMKNKFPFYGIKTPERRAILKKFTTEFGKEIIPIRYELAFAFLEKAEREWHQLAVDLLLFFKKFNQVDDLIYLERFILTHSWWDTVDMIASNLVGPILLKNPEVCTTWISSWRTHKSMWLNRTCIIFQLKYKTKVNQDLLVDLIHQFKTSNEFFIQKAIGWMLREYAKTNPNWVLNLTQTIDLKPLSKREALRLIQK